MEEEGKPKFSFSNPFKKKTEQQSPQPRNPEKKANPELGEQVQKEILKAFENFETNPAETVKHLTSKEFAEKFGLKVAGPDETRVIIFDLNKEHSDIDLDNIASDLATFSKFLPETDTIKMGKIIPVDFNNVTAEGEDISRLPERLLRESALVDGEELLHFVQKQKGSITGHEDAEQDVALFYKKNGIAMTDSFLNRYGRKEAVEASEK